jgi:DNA-binding NtrC family response regulator
MSHQPVFNEPLHVVVVDDDDLVRATLIDWLEAAGFATSAAAGFESGLQILRAARPVDALVTDYNLAPTVTGVQLALEARKLKPALPIVFITGNLTALAADQAVPGAIVMAKATGFAKLAQHLQSAIAQSR